MLNATRYRFGRVLRKMGFGFDAEKNPAVQQMLEKIDSLKDRTIIFSLEVDKDGNWAVASKNLPGLITGGELSDNINDVILDAIFTYFDIPPEFCDPYILSEEYAISKHQHKSTDKKYIYSLVTSAHQAA